MLPSQEWGPTTWIQKCGGINKKEIMILHMNALKQPRILVMNKNSIVFLTYK